MIGRVVSKIAGPRVLVGVLVAALAVSGFLCWRWVAALESAEKWRSAAEVNAAAVDALRAERRAADRAVAAAEARGDRLRGQARELRARLEEAKRNAPEAIQACGERALPRDLTDGLRVHPDDDSGGAGDATGQPDGRLPRTGSDR